MSLQPDDRWEGGKPRDCRFTVSGQSCRVTSGPCRCARRPAGGSPGSARRSTSGTCTRTWWSGWPATCRSLARSTSPRSRRRRETSCCRPAPLSPSTLEREREREGDFQVKFIRIIGCRNSDIIWSWGQLCFLEELCLLCFFTCTFGNLVPKVIFC